MGVGACLGEKSPHPRRGFCREKHGSVELDAPRRLSARLHRMLPPHEFPGNLIALDVKPGKLVDWCGVSDHSLLIRLPGDYRWLVCVCEVLQL